MSEIYSHRVRSSLGGVAWPGIPSRAGASLLALQFQLEQTQWLSGEELNTLQLQQLEVLLAHACATVPHYRKSFAELGVERWKGLTLEQWRRLPIITREDIQTGGDALVSTDIPAHHGKVTTISTSGSTGRPIVAHRTEAVMLFWNAFTLRDHYWNRRDLSAKFAAIRPEGGLEPGRGSGAANWGSATAHLFDTGPSVMLSVRTDIETQARWLMDEAPAYLLSLPSNLLALAQHFEQLGVGLESLKEVRSYGEQLGPEVRQACRMAWGVEVKDMYSAQEVGYMALQCPEGDHYHVQSEGILLEVLDGDGNPCTPGEVGRVVVTPLHNFAMPLIRYEVGDYAEVGGSCGCGRGLPVLNRVLGRQRNMLTLPDGRKHWPSFPAEDWAHLGPIRQVQLVQTDLESITINMVAERYLEPGEEEQLFSVLRERMGHPFRFTLNYPDVIERSKSGKYEDFVSLV